MEEHNTLKERILLEKKITQAVLINKCRVFKLCRGGDGRIMSFSPYLADTYTSLWVSKFARYKYSHLSGKIHKLEDERAEIEREIAQLSPIKKPSDILFHEYIGMFNESYELFVKNQINSRKLPAIKKADYNRLQKLARKWREASQDCHYSLTKQEKRYLKKRVAKSHNLL